MRSHPRRSRTRVSRLHKKCSRFEKRRSKESL